MNSDNNGYEKSDVRFGKILLSGGAAIIVLILIVLFSIDYFEITREELTYDAVLKPKSIELTELQAREAEILGSYDIVDSTKGVYRIPIEQAMKIMAGEAGR